ncbi:hypothetical protein J6590_088648, partial [Homalodisca vitripennis]
DAFESSVLTMQLTLLLVLREGTWSKRHESSRGQPVSSGLQQPTSRAAWSATYRATLSTYYIGVFTLNSQDFPKNRTIVLPDEADCLICVCFYLDLPTDEPRRE